MQTLYDQFQARFAFYVTDQWRENPIFQKIKQGPSEVSVDFIRRVEAERVRIKATADDVRDTILQGLLPTILNSIMQHELSPRLEDIRKWAKMAERYSNDSVKSGKDIAEIKSTLNDLATQLNRTQLSAITPERRTVQFTDSAPTRAHPRELFLAVPIHNFDPFTGQRLNNKPIYDVTTGERLQSSTPFRQRQENSTGRPPPRNRSPSLSYNNNYSGRDNNIPNNQIAYNKSSSSQRDSSQEYSRRENTPQYHSRDYSRSSSPRRDNSPQHQYDYTCNDHCEQSYSNPGYDTRNTQSYNHKDPPHRYTPPSIGAILHNDNRSFNSLNSMVQVPQ